MNILLLEIGTEEIPAGYIEPALKALSTNLLKALSDARIEHGDAATFGTPKRLAVEIKNVASKQKSITTEVTGPPEKVGFNANGRPTVAAEKFAEKIGIPVNRIKIKNTKKGPYLCATRTETGLLTKRLLKNILPETILSTPFPKTMRWADLCLDFARPIQSILALFGNSAVSFKLGNIKSGRYTFGHRFTHPGKIKISNPQEYIKSLESADVLADIDQRKKCIEDKISKAANRLGGGVLPDGALVDTVTNLVEYPAVAAGKFDIKYLELPGEVLITSMREHQKYFAVIDESGKLMPCFIVVNNTPAKDMAVVARGHERVLRARLEDAMFFYQKDLESSIEDLTEKLKRVLFQAKLGTMYEKVIRVQKIAGFLADAVDGGADFKKQVQRAAFLCKFDLVSHIVVEFPKLQGVMGKIYSSIAKEPDEVAAAIKEHYMPIYSGGPLPGTDSGAILGIADKIDSICGCFSAGLIPTGASDPYALRRQGIGIVQIMLDKGLTFSLKSLIENSVILFGSKSEHETKETVGKVHTFLQNRISHLLAEQGFAKDTIAAIISVSTDNVPNVWNRVRALENLKSKPDFEPIAVAFKRVVNIIKKSGQTEIYTVNKELFQHECEHALFAAYNEVKIKVLDNLDRANFDRALADMACLRNFVDDFFDGVMVMAKDAGQQRNRLALLGLIAGLFALFADFSKIST